NADRHEDQAPTLCSEFGMATEEIHPVDKQCALAAPGRRRDQHARRRLRVEKPSIEVFQFDITAAKRHLAGLGTQILVKERFGGASEGLGDTEIEDGGCEFAVVC